MPMLRLGSMSNMEDVQLGSTQVEQVRLGSDLIWQNNVAPQIVLTTPAGGALGDTNFNINVVVSTAQNVVFTVDDPDAADTVSTVTGTDPSGAALTITGFTAGSNSDTGVTFTIPATAFTTIGPVSSNNVYTITVTDNRGGTADYTITVTNATPMPPSLSATPGNQTEEALTAAGNQSQAFAYTLSGTPAGWQAQYSTDGGATWVNGTSVSRTATATCGNNSSVTVHGRMTHPTLGTVASSPASVTRRLSVQATRANLNPTFTGCLGCLVTTYRRRRQCDGTINDFTAVQNFRFQARPCGTPITRTFTWIGDSTSLGTATGGTLNILSRDNYNFVANLVYSGGAYTSTHSCTGATATAQQLTFSTVGTATLTPGTIAVGGTSTYTAGPPIAGATYGGCNNLSSSNTGTATAAGNTVTGVATGTATITCSSHTINWVSPAGNETGTWTNTRSRAITVT